MKMQTHSNETARYWVAYAFGIQDTQTCAFTPDPDGEHLRVTALEGTAAHPSGIPGASAYTVEIRDLFGIILRRETHLFDGAAAGPLLAWEDSAHDPKGRLLSTAFSDGTALSNIWGCCRLDAAVRRDGTRLETWEIPGFPLWSAEAETSLGSLPGLNGCYPVTEIYSDTFGRMTNTVISVWSNGSPSYAHARISTTTAYPYGTSDYMVTTDPFGTQTVYFVTLAGSARITTTRTPGITNSVTQYYGGNTVYTSSTTNGIDTTTYATTYMTNGCRLDTVTVVTNSVAVTNIVTEYDFLGNPVVTAAPAAFPESYVSYQQISNIWYRTCVGSVVSNGITNTLFTAVRQLTGLSWPMQQRVTITDTNNETVVVTVSSTSVPTIRTVTRQNLSLDTIETTAYIGIYPIYYVDNSGVTNTFFYEHDTANQITLQTQAQESFGFGILGLFPTFDEIMAMVRSHFESLRIKLTGELTSLCPEKATKLDGKRACCNPSACKTDARIMASSYIAALEAAWWARTVPVGGFIGNVMIDMAGGNGLNYPEDIGPGLVCDGWRGMAETILFPIASKSNCWTFENGTRNGLITFFTGEPAHVWAILKSTNGTIGLDPWPSGGWSY